ncbi:MAG: O-antigen ligase family protein [Terriglobia bacterium]
MRNREKIVEIVARECTLMAAVLPLISIAAASIFLSLAILGFVVLQFLNRYIEVKFPPIKLPLAIFMGTTFLALAFSPEPGMGFPPINKFWLFSLIPLVCTLFSEATILRGYRILFLLGGMGVLRSLYQWFGLQPDGRRITGFMGHWMTFSGELMLVFVALVGYLYFLRPQRMFGWILLAVGMGVALGLSMTRSVWIATILGLCCILALGKLNCKLLTMMGLIVALLLSIPGPVQRRFQSLWDSSNPSNYARRAIWKAGFKMIAAHPLVGVGPQRVSKVFYDYHEYPEDRYRDGFFPVHLHNNLLQFAGERGIPCAIAWLWLMAKLVVDHWLSYTRFLKDAAKKTICAIGLIAVIVLFVGGQFEFNFGDSEVLMVFLFLAIAPYALDRGGEMRGTSGELGG